MISIASYMSTASTATNICSNNLSEQKFNGQILSDENENNSKTNRFLKDKNDEELDIDSYFNLNFSTTLNNIAYNFMESTNNTLTENSSESKVISHPIIKKSNNQIGSTLPNSNLAKMNSLKDTKELSIFPKSNESKENLSIPKSQTSGVSLNPFEDEITDDSNSFVNDESLETTTIEVDNNFNIKLNSKNNETSQNDSSNKTTKDLLNWCKDIINCSKLLNHNLLNNLEVNDFSGSWTNGLAFCVIIHHFRPNLM